MKYAARHSHPTNANLSWRLLRSLGVRCSALPLVGMSEARLERVRSKGESLREMISLLAAFRALAKFTRCWDLPTSDLRHG